MRLNKRFFAHYISQTAIAVAALVIACSAASAASFLAYPSVRVGVGTISASGSAASSVPAALKLYGAFGSFVCSVSGAERQKIPYRVLQEGACGAAPSRRFDGFPRSNSEERGVCEASPVVCVRSTYKRE